MPDASNEVRVALIGDIVHALDFAMYHAKGTANGYGLAADGLDGLRDALEHIVDALAGAQVKLVRPEVRRECETREKVDAAWRDRKYVDLIHFKLHPRPGWKGNKKLRAEVEALYKPEVSDAE